MLACRPEKSEGVQVMKPYGCYIKDFELYRKVMAPTLSHIKMLLKSQ